MRLAMISDIHGNQIALEAVLADLRQHAPDRIVCLGDVATIGPHPKGVLDILRSLDCVLIQGNHDEALLKPDKAVALNIGEVLLPTLDWALRKLDAEDIAFIQSFLPSYQLELDGKTTISCFHGSPTSNIDLVLATTPAGELEAMLGPEPTAVMAGGHSHIQMLRQHRGKLVINPGSVGHGFMEPYRPHVEPTLVPWAEYAIVDSLQGTITVSQLRVPFDTEACLQAVRDSDNPSKPWWLQQYRSNGSYSRTAWH